MRAARNRRADPGPALGEGSGAPPRRRAARALFGPARRWLRPPRRLRPTRAGWIFFALTFGVGFAALNTGNNLLYLVLSLMLAFLVLSGLLSEAALRGISVRRRPLGEFGAGRDGWVQLEIANRQSRLAAYAVAVEDRIRVDGQERPAGRTFALRIDPGGRVVRSYRLVPERRGDLHFAGFAVFTRFPFGLFSKSLALESPGRVLVYPQIDAAEPAPPVMDRGESADRASAGSDPGATVGGLREFAAGDPPRRIDWRRSLRSGELWVRELDPEPQGEVWVQLDTRGREAGEAFERDVRRAASRVESSLACGLRVGLRSESESFEAAAGPAQRTRLLSFLARVAPAQGARA